MPLSGGRRIKRSIYLDLHSIKFCSEEMLERFKEIQLIADYVKSREEEIDRHNHDLQVHSSNKVYGRRMTNIGVFRAYVEAYLKALPMISSNMTFLVRQLTPDEIGLPLEIYVFSKETEWGKYEKIQADLFDHILSVVSQFDLCLF